MNSKEVRIGNYINTIAGINRIKAIYEEVFKFETFYQGSDFAPHDRITPILLTEEWLVKFGLEELYLNTYKTSESWQIHKFGEFWRVGWLKSSDSWHPEQQGQTLQLIPIRIEYVHQFQNFYFILTNQELVVKE